MNKLLILLAISAELLCANAAVPRTSLKDSTLTEAEKAAITDCTATFERSHPSVTKAERHVNGYSLVCFDGIIDRSSADSFANKVRSLRFKPIVVIRSGGGEVNAGMDIGEVLADLGGTVIVLEKCLSSCANYVLASAARKIVLQDSLLGFHGGVELVDRGSLVKELAEAGFTDPKQVDASIRGSEADRERQDRFLKRKGISVTFYDRITGWNYLPVSKRETYCSNSEHLSMFVLDPRLLARFGYQLQSYLGPQNKEELARTLAKQNRRLNSFCYIGADKSFL